MEKPRRSRSDNVAILVVSCSDSRLTAAESAESWRMRLGFDGPIYEVRCPGGGIALADQSSTFYQSARESFQLLAQSKVFGRIILAAHEDCAYFQGKYGSHHSDAQDRDDLKLWLMEEAVRNVETWEPRLPIETVYISFTDRDTDPHGLSHESDCVFCAQVARDTTPRLPARDIYLPEHATQAVIDRVVEERLLSAGGSIESIMSAIESRSGEKGGMPAWRIERRAREFIALLKSEGRRFDPEQKRQLTKAFVQSYVGADVPRMMSRAVMASLEPELTTASTRRLLWR